MLKLSIWDTSQTTNILTHLFAKFTTFLITRLINEIIPSRLDLGLIVTSSNIYHKFPKNTFSSWKDDTIKFLKKENYIKFFRIFLISMRVVSRLDYGLL